MAFHIKDVPKDVQWVWDIKVASEYTKMGVGKKVFGMCQDIIKRYPEWFPLDPNEEIPLSKQRVAEIQRINTASKKE